jgi:GntR family transcriptional repressor for pyruvate dehydrogenase complex
MNAPFDIELPALPPDISGASALTPIRLPNAAEQVAERLVTAISLGEFVTGQRLPPVAQLAGQLGVNQTSIREALQRLAATGYVRIVRGRCGGAFVTNAWGPDSAEIVRRVLVPNWPSFEHLFDLRRLVEPLIAHTATLRHTEEEAEEIVAANDAYVRAGDDREASRAADQTLHTVIATATHNPYLVSLSLQLRARVSLGFQAEPYSRAIRETAIGQHARLVTAILDRNPQTAALEAHDHFALTEDALRALYRRVLAARDEHLEACV